MVIIRHLLQEMDKGHSCTLLILLTKIRTLRFDTPEKGRWRKISDLHGVLGAALGHATQRGHVLEHLGEWHAGLDQPQAARLVEELADDAAARVEVADDVAHVLLRRRHLHLGSHAVSHWLDANNWGHMQ